MTEVLRVDRDRPDASAIARAAACLRAGGLVAFPTETVYGLGVHALDRPAILRLFAAKERPANDPLIVHVGSIEGVARLVTSLPAAAHELAARFWPGPLTLVLPRGPMVPNEVTSGRDTVAIRVPSHPVARALLESANLPVAAPSANRFSRPSPTRAEHVLHDLDGRIDMIVDGGPTDVGVESTVVDLTSAVPRVLRPGAVTVEMLRAVVPQVEAGAITVRDADEAAPSPGLLSKHYAPRTPLTLFRGSPEAVTAAIEAAAREALARGERVGLLATSDTTGIADRLPLTVCEVGAAADVEQIARRLYAALRELDERGLDLILAADLQGSSGLAAAVRDRLQRAAGRIIENN